MKNRLLYTGLIVLFNHLLYGQTIVGNKYINKTIGISFNVDSNWSIGIDGPIVFALNHPKGEEITLETTKLSSPDTNGFKHITKAELTAYRAAMIETLEESSGAIVKSISAKVDKFLNFDCVTTIYHTEKQDLLNCIPMYYKNITFLINENYQITIIYSIPESILSANEIKIVEKNIKTFKILN